MGVLSYFVRRALYGVLVLFGVNLATFVLFFTVNTPDDMARLNIGGKRVTQDQIEKWKAERGYDKPLWWNDAREGAEKLTQTIFWERSISLFELKFGRADSEAAGDIGSEVARRMRVSVQLALPIFVLQILVSVWFALSLALFRNSPLDFAGVVLCVLLLSISALFYAIVGQFTFGRLMRLVPISGYGSGLDVVRFLVLPVLLSVAARLGNEARLYRTMLLEETGKDYVRTARAKGVAPLSVTTRHALRNALLPVITIAGLQFGSLLSGSIIIEKVFARPGLGLTLLDAIRERNYPVVQGCVLVIAVIYVVVNTGVDLAYGLADPRIRRS